MNRLTSRIFVALIVVLALAAGCGGCDDGTTGPDNGTPFEFNNATNNGTSGGGDASDTDLDARGGDATNGPDGGGPTLDIGVATDAPTTPINDAGMADCGGVPCACSDGLDNDGDGLIDGQDPECTGAFDNDEATFATGIPGDNRDPKWQDCFFDGNSGAGDDKCRYHTECLTGERPPTDPTCQVSARCFEFCRPLTPNGCDCFGCCEVFDGIGRRHQVIIGGTCSVDKLGTPACVECTRNTECVNTCGRCELCLGRQLSDLPADCFPSGGDAGTDGGGPGLPACDDGEVQCRSGLDCPSNSFCQLGCCLRVVP